MAITLVIQSLEEMPVSWSSACVLIATFGAMASLNKTEIVRPS